MKQAVILDIDGTLLHSVEVDDALYRQAVQHVLGSVDLRPSLRDYPHVTDTALLLQIMEDNGIAPSGVTIERVKATFFERLHQHMQRCGPFAQLAGAQRFLEHLVATQDIEVAIATGGWRESALMKLHSAGLDARNVPIATSDDASERVGIMRVALDCLPGPFESIMYYGDGEWDRKASRDLGWKFRAVGASLSGIENFDSEIDNLS